MNPIEKTKTKPNKPNLFGIVEKEKRERKEN
jgi:hypothetical protein